MIPIWIDTDTGVDDANALICASYLNNLNLVGVSAVAGNQIIDHTFPNARNVLSFINREDIKVYKGSDKPLKKKLRVAEYAHGKNGLGDYIIPESKAAIEKKDAIDALYECAKEYDGELVLIAIGPLTNVALAFRKYPDLKNLLKEIVIMGGGIVRGNVTKYAEFNIYCDPEAANEVFNSSCHIVMCGLDVTLKAYLKPDELKEIANFNNSKSNLFINSSRLLIELQEMHKREGLCNHDLCAVLYVSNPEMFNTYDACVDVEINDEEHYGQTIIIEGKNNTSIVDDIDREKMKEIMMEIYQKD